MSYSRVSKALRERIEERDRHRCSYCLTPEAITGAPMEIDHIVPESLGGPTTLKTSASPVRSATATRPVGSPPLIPRRMRWHGSSIRSVSHGTSIWSGTASAIESRDAPRAAVHRAPPLPPGWYFGYRAPLRQSCYSRNHDPSPPTRFTQRAVSA